MHVGYVAAGAVVIGPNHNAIAGLSATAPLHTAPTDQLADMVVRGARMISAELGPTPRSEP